MDKLIIVPQSNLKTAKHDVSDFAVLLKQELNLDVQFGKYNQKCFAVTWWEVVSVWLPAGSIYLVGKLLHRIIDRSIEWAEKRLKIENKEQKAHPKCIKIYGPDGKPISTIMVHNDGEKAIKREIGLDDNQKKLPPDLPNLLNR